MSQVSTLVFHPLHGWKCNLEKLLATLCKQMLIEIWIEKKKQLKKPKRWCRQLMKKLSSEQYSTVTLHLVTHHWPIDCEGIYGTEKHLTLPYPTIFFPPLNQIHLKRHYCYAVGTIKFSLPWWDLLTPSHINTFSPAAKNLIIVGIIVFRPSRLTLKVIEPVSLIKGFYVGEGIIVIWRVSFVYLGTPHIISGPY